MAIDAGIVTYQMPAMNGTASATPAVSNVITFVAAAVKGGFLVTEDMDLVEAGCTYAVAATSAVVWKLQLCRDTQIGNVVDILGVPAGSPLTASALCTAPAATAAVGSTLSKRYNFRLAKGDVVLFTVTTGAAGAGQGYFYAKCYPRGETTLPTKLQGATVVSTVASTT